TSGSPPVLSISLSDQSFSGLTSSLARTLAQARPWWRSMFFSKRAFNTFRSFSPCSGGNFFLGLFIQYLSDPAPPTLMQNTLFWRLVNRRGFSGSGRRWGGVHGWGGAVRRFLGPFRLPMGVLFLLGGNSVADASSAPQPDDLSLLDQPVKGIGKGTAGPAEFLRQIPGGRLALAFDKSQELLKSVMVSVTPSSFSEPFIGLGYWIRWVGVVFWRFDRVWKSHKGPLPS